MKIDSPKLILLYAQVLDRVPAYWKHGKGALDQVAQVLDRKVRKRLRKEEIERSIFAENMITDMKILIALIGKHY